MDILCNMRMDGFNNGVQVVRIQSEIFRWWSQGEMLCCLSNWLCYFWPNDYFQDNYRLASSLTQEFDQLRNPTIDTNLVKLSCRNTD